MAMGGEDIKKGSREGVSRGFRGGGEMAGVVKKLKSRKRRKKQKKVFQKIGFKKKKDKF